MVKIVKQNFGSQLLIGLYGENPIELEDAFNSFYNHGATNGEPDYGHDLFLTFWTTPAKLDKYFYNSSYHTILSQYHDNPAKNFEAEVKKLAEKRKLAIIDEKIINYDYTAKADEEMEIPEGEGILVALPQEAEC